jgi:hypothetical protein
LNTIQTAELLAARIGYWAGGGRGCQRPGKRLHAKGLRLKENKGGLQEKRGVLKETREGSSREKMRSARE